MKPVCETVHEAVLSRRSCSSRSTAIEMNGNATPADDLDGYELVSTSSPLTSDLRSLSCKAQINATTLYLINAVKHVSSSTFVLMSVRCDAVEVLLIHWWTWSGDKSSVRLVSFPPHAPLSENTHTHTLLLHWATGTQTHSTALVFWLVFRRDTSILFILLLQYWTQHVNDPYLWNINMEYCIPQCYASDLTFKKLVGIP